MVFPAIIVATSEWMLAPGRPLIVVAPSPADHLVVALCLASVAEVVQKHGGPVGYRCSSGLGTSRGFPVMPRRCRGQVRDAPVPSGGGTLGLLNRGGL